MLNYRVLIESDALVLVWSHPCFFRHLALKCTLWPKTSCIGCTGSIWPRHAETIIIFSNDLRIAIMISIRKAIFEPYGGDYEVIMINFGHKNHRLGGLQHRFSSIRAKGSATQGLPKASPLLVLLSPIKFKFEVLMGPSALVLVWLQLCFWVIGCLSACHGWRPHAWVTQGRFDLVVLKLS